MAESQIYPPAIASTLEYLVLIFLILSPSLFPCAGALFILQFIRKAGEIKNKLIIIMERFIVS